MKCTAPLCVKFAQSANEIPRGGVKCLLAGVGKEKMKLTLDEKIEALGKCKPGESCFGCALYKSAIKDEQAQSHNCHNFAYEVILELRGDNKELTRENKALRDACWQIYDMAQGSIKADKAMSIGLKACSLSRKSAVEDMRDRLLELYSGEGITDDMHVSIGVIRQNIIDVSREQLEGPVEPAEEEAAEPQ